MKNTYTVALTKSGQMTLPKALREFLGVEGAKHVILVKEQNGIAIKRKLSRKEYFALMDSHIPPHVKEIAKKNRGKSTREMINEYLNSPAGQKEMEEKFGPRFTRR